MKKSNSNFCTELSTPQIIAVIFALLTALNVFSQKNYPFNVRVTGAGTTDLIFMPGLSCSGDVWDETVEHYQKNYRCHILTMDGFAGVAADSNVSFKNWEKGIVQYINDKHIVKPIFVGHSIGGGMAYLIASDYPDLLSKIVVVDALPCLGGLTNQNFKAEKNPDCSKYVEQFKDLSKEQFYEMQKHTLPGMMADTSHLEQAIS
ncbi:MAG: alpha/beta fold hydrolase, partial [Bacteroidia bacterium]